MAIKKIENPTEYEPEREEMQEAGITAWQPTEPGEMLTGIYREREEIVSPDPDKKGDTFTAHHIEQEDQYSNYNDQ